MKQHDLVPFFTARHAGRTAGVSACPDHRPVCRRQGRCDAGKAKHLAHVADAG
nr:MAG TPA: hypothetical protein [Caudoviricetes sp.]